MIRCRNLIVSLPRLAAGGSSSSRLYSADAKSKKVGLVGMGSVGDAVFHNLKRNGFQVSAIMDIDSSICSKYDAAKKTTAREVAEVSDVIVTGLPKPPHVKAAFEGPDGILAGIKKGGVWIDHSTTDYGQNFEFQKELDTKGAQMLEAPITGGMEALKQGQMAVWVAGEKNIYEENKPILDASYSTVMYMGGLGTAMIPKVISNMLCTVTTVAMGESLMIAKRSGLDLPTFWHAIRASAGNSFLWETAGPCIMNGDFHSDFNMDLICKDIHLNYEMARNAKVPIELFGLMQQIYNKTLYQCGDESGCYSPPKLLEAALGESLRAPGFDKWSYSVENVDGALHVRHKNIDLKMDAPEGQKAKV